MTQNRIFKDGYIDAAPVMVTVVAASIPFLIAFGASYWLAVPYILLACLHTHGSQHYQIHRPFFVSKRANRIYELLGVAVCGIGHYEYKLMHLEHHKLANDRQVNGLVNDPVSTYRWGCGQEEPFLQYIFKTSLRNTFSQDGVLPKNIEWDAKRLKQENAVKMIVLALMCLINIWFVPFYFLMLYAAWTLNWIENYGEHHGAVDQDDPRRDSVSSYGSVYNFLFLNLGYHQEHHYRPGVHWTRLPEVKKQLPADRRIVKYTLFSNNPIAQKLLP
jgi:fatty acid desaturase